MWFEGAGEVVEMFKTSFPLSLMFFIPIFIIISPVSPVGAAHEFAVFRMQQYDLQGSNYGCRSAVVNVEARAIDAKVYTRRCVISRLSELTMEKFRDMVSQNAGALLVLLPNELQNLSKEEKDYLLELEQDLMTEETQMPVFFTKETQEILDIYADVRSSVNNDQAGSAAEALLSSASANGFQMVVNGPTPKAQSDFTVVNLQGKLAGYGIEEQLPTIAIVAHYDAFSVAPSLSFGGDSNGSGVIALLELARLFSKLYTNSRTHAKFNILFLLSGGGKFNYQGTKRWIEDQYESAESSLLQDASFVLCLDTLGNTNALNLHVSKPPKEGSSGDQFYKGLTEVASELYPEVEMGMKHKKINLADDYLAWEHEKFSIKRLPAFTLSRLESHKDYIRNSLLDDRSNVDSAVLARNVKILAEGLARHIFNLSSIGSLEIFNEGLRVEDELIEAWKKYLTENARSAQLLDKNSHVVATLEQAMSKYLKDVKRHSFKADKRDPEFVFYSGTEYQMDAYNVKPAVFDLFLALGIAAYLSVIFVIVQVGPPTPKNFGSVYSLMRKLSGPIKAKKQ